MRRNLLVLYNPHAGPRGQSLFKRVVKALERRGVNVVTRQIGEGHDVSHRLTDAGSFDAVIAAGGDGTIRAVLTALDGRNVPVGLVPTGTGNVLAHEIRLPRLPAKLADVLSSGPMITFQGGRANGAPFFLMAGIGFDGDVIGHLNRRLKRHVGKLAYASAIARSLAKAPAEFEVMVDGQRFVADWVVASRVRHYGGKFELAPNACLKKPGLVAVLFQSTSRQDRARQLMALARRRLNGAAGVTYVSCSKLSVNGPHPIAVEVDGDAMGTTPLEITSNGPDVSLIVPGEYAEGA